MRKLYLFIFISFILNALFSDCRGQAYIPFPDSGAVWNVENVSTDGMNFYDAHISYFFSGDTINALGNSYKELNLSGNEVVTQILCCNTYSYSFSGTANCGLRQDVAAHKVYLYNTGNGQETIFIDFNFQVGDSLLPSNITWGYPFSLEAFHITSIDSVLIAGSFRRRYNFQAISGASVFTGDTSIIEGIGSTSGLFMYPNTFESGGHLECFSLFNNELYPVFSSVPCGLNSVAETIFDGGIKVYPSLSNTELFVKIPLQYKNCDYFIADVSGKELLKGKLQSQDNSIHIKSLSAGVYFIHVNTKDKSFVKKFFKM